MYFSKKKKKSNLKNYRRRNLIDINDKENDGNSTRVNNKQNHGDYLCNLFFHFDFKLQGYIGLNFVINK